LGLLFKGLLFSCANLFFLLVLDAKGLTALGDVRKALEKLPHKQLMHPLFPFLITGYTLNDGGQEPKFRL